MTYKNVVIESDFIRFIKVYQAFSEQRNRNRNDIFVHSSIFIFHY